MYSCLSLCGQCQAGLSHYRQCLAGRPTHSPPNVSRDGWGPRQASPAQPHRVDVLPLAGPWKAARDQQGVKETPENQC